MSRKGKTQSPDFKAKVALAAIKGDETLIERRNIIKPKQELSIVRQCKLLCSGLFDLAQNTSVELLYLAVTTSALYACVVVQSRALLLTTVIAMLVFIGYYSAEHFANSLGCPVTFIFMGVAFLAVGTLAIKVKQRI